MTQVLRDIIAQNRAGQAVAIPSVCTAHDEALKASLMLAERLDQPVVIEATSNQVNQFGGYTGMQAADFVDRAGHLAREGGVNTGRITFGGDHLGPQAWRSEDADSAMTKAEDLVRSYVTAGINKIHLDCSEGCAGEAAALPDEVTAKRAARLAQVAVEAAKSPEDLLFVVGTEVPPPGGARVDEDGHIAATKPSSATATIAAHKHHMGDLWSLVGGLVVQPGVEFSPMQIHHMPQGADPGLRAVSLTEDGLCLEAHSTDYQDPAVFPQLAELGFAFQKVGPALTFAWRRAVYALDALLGALSPMDSPDTRLPEVLERVMLEQPKNWQGHYHAEASDDLRLMRHFGLADRIRYYWPVPLVAQSVDALFDRLNAMTLPDYVFADVFSPETLALADQIDAPRAKSLAYAEVQRALLPYFFGGRA